MNLNDKVIFVTGAASGIGKASCLACAGYGAKIVAVDLREEEVMNTVEEIKAKGGDAIGIVANVTDRKTVKAAVDTAIAKYGRIDVLFNNAGVVKPGQIIELTDEQYDFTMDINVKGSFIVAAEVAKAMIPNKKGRIISTSSISGIKGEFGGSTYCMSKAAVAMLTQVLSLELGQYNITAVAIAPGHIDTELLRGAFRDRAAEEGKTTEVFTAEMEATIPLGKLGKPEEIAELVAFLSDNRSSYINGNNIVIAGGKIVN